MSVIVITRLNTIILHLINCSLLYRFETKDVMMIDVGDHLIKLYMQPLMQEKYSYMETVVIGLLLRDQFQNVKIKIYY